MAIIGATTEAIRRSLLTAIGDMIYASAVSTPARLAAVASGQVLTAQGVGAAPAWAAAAGATKEFFIPVTHGTEMLSSSNYGPVARCNISGEHGAIYFKVPADFTSLTTAVIVVIPRATQAAANWDIQSVYGAIGEAYNIHTGANATTTYNVTDNQLYGVNISGILASLAVGDYVGVTLRQMTDGHDVDVVGVAIKYA